jgi:hypothetical protein
VISDQIFPFHGGRTNFARGVAEGRRAAPQADQEGGSRRGTLLSAINSWLFVGRDLRSGHRSVPTLKLFSDMLIVFRSIPDSLHILSMTQLPQFPFNHSAPQINITVDWFMGIMVSGRIAATNRLVVFVFPGQVPGNGDE